MDLQRLKEQKKRLGLTNAELAKLAGIPVSTVAKVMGGTTPSPRINTILALETALGLRQLSKGRSAYSDSADKNCSMDLVQEGDHPYVYGSGAENLRKSGLKADVDLDPGHSQSETDHRARSSGREKELEGYNFSAEGRNLSIETVSPAEGTSNSPLHTIRDYLALPDDRRVELIDGHFYDLAAPSGIHQQLTLLVWMALHQCIEQHGMSCVAQAAPFDVQLDEYTVVEPDVMVFCEEPEQGFAARATSPPDLVVEVLSRSTAFKDRHLKLFKYRRAGVKELWLVSPKEEKVEVYAFSEDMEEPDVYTFEDVIPVLISEGKCRVDFRGIRKRLPEKLV